MMGRHCPTGCRVAAASVFMWFLIVARACAHVPHIPRAPDLGVAEYPKK